MWLLSSHSVATVLLSYYVHVVPNVLHLSTSLHVVENLLIAVDARYANFFHPNCTSPQSLCGGVGKDILPTPFVPFDFF